MEKRMLNRLVTIILSLIVTSFLAACIQPLPASESMETNSNDAPTIDTAVDTVALRAEWSGEIDTLNPIATWSGDTKTVLNLLYDALYQVETDGSITPEIVDTAEASEDGTTWTLTLREDFTFSDGGR